MRLSVRERAQIAAAQTEELLLHDEMDNLGGGEGLVRRVLLLRLKLCRRRTDRASLAASPAIAEQFEEPTGGAGVGCPASFRNSEACGSDAPQPITALQ